MDLSYLTLPTLVNTLHTYTHIIYANILPPSRIKTPHPINQLTPEREKIEKKSPPPAPPRPTQAPGPSEPQTALHKIDTPGNNNAQLTMTNQKIKKKDKKKFNSGARWGCEVWGGMFGEGCLGREVWEGGRLIIANRTY